MWGISNSNIENTFIFHGNKIWFSQRRIMLSSAWHWQLTLTIFLCWLIWMVFHTWCDRWWYGTLPKHYDMIPASWIIVDGLRRWRGWHCCPWWYGHYWQFRWSWRSWGSGWWYWKRSRICVLTQLTSTCKNWWLTKSTSYRWMPG